MRLCVALKETSRIRWIKGRTPSAQRPEHRNVCEFLAATALPSPYSDLWLVDPGRSSACVSWFYRKRRLGRWEFRLAGWTVRTRSGGRRRCPRPGTRSPNQVVRIVRSPRPSSSHRHGSIPDDRGPKHRLREDRAQQASAGRNRDANGEERVPRSVSS